MEATVFNDAPLDLLRLMSYVNSPQSLGELRSVISKHFAQKAKEEMERMWATGEMTQEKYDNFRMLHERTRRQAKEALSLSTGFYSAKSCEDFSESCYNF